MEFQALSDRELEDLVRHDPQLSESFAGVYAADTLPKTPPRSSPQAYIVNTDPHHRPGRHWIALWTDGDVCQIMDSYGLPLASHGTPHLQTWLRRHWPITEANTQSLQALNSATCGHYALRFLIERCRGRTFRHFLELFRPHDYVYNDTVIARWMKRYMIQHMLE